MCDWRKKVYTRLESFSMWVAILAVLVAGCGPASTSKPATPAAASVTQAPELTFAPSSSPTDPPPLKEPAVDIPTLTPSATWVPPTPTPSPTSLPTITPAALQGSPAMVSVEVLDVWDDPAHELGYWDRQTQLILGERVLVLAESGDWDRIVAVEQPSHKDPRGYPGWVRKAGLVNGWNETGQVAVVMAIGAKAHSLSDFHSGVVQSLPFDTRLAVRAIRDGWVQVLLPDSRLAWIPQDDYRLTDLSQDHPSLDGFYDTAQTFLKTPYLWGGTANGALDCSGFLYRLYHAYGITIPRDADDQALLGVEAPAATQRRGDLIFTTEQKYGPITHVVMVWGDGLVMDEDTPKGLTIHPLADLFLISYQASARRILP